MIWFSVHSIPVTEFKCYQSLWFNKIPLKTSCQSQSLCWLSLDGKLNVSDQVVLLLYNGLIYSEVKSIIKRRVNEYLA